jgi:hypothetical protein
MSVREIEKHGEMSVRKVEWKDAPVLYVVVRIEGKKETTVAREWTLGKARQAAGIPYTPPTKETKPKKDYSQYTGTGKKQ